MLQRKRLNKPGNLISISSTDHSSIPNDMKIGTIINGDTTVTPPRPNSTFSYTYAGFVSSATFPPDEYTG